ncbi:hypothetical protein PR001_g9929 [Phytophthora rubi]|uniref:Pectate lyase n=1 Tax=Phytophthora rubi TaxID=129364 RepID=A0A6A3MM60_9STRA|nr:hypothetical protein PR001_g9929 [Phytophthora rubi]
MKIIASLVVALLAASSVSAEVTCSTFHFEQNSEGNMVIVLDNCNGAVTSGSTVIAGTSPGATTGSSTPSTFNTPTAAVATAPSTPTATGTSTTTGTSTSSAINSGGGGNDNPTNVNDDGLRNCRIDFSCSHKRTVQRCGGRI